MSILQTKPPRSVVVVLAFLQAFAIATCLADEVSPIVDDRVKGDIVQHPEISQIPEKKAGWKLQAIISAAYDNNIYLSKTNPESDHVYRVGPKISYAKGDVTEGSGGFVQFAYNPTAVYYAKASSESRIDQRATWTAGWRGKATVVAYDGSILKTADALADVGRKTDRMETENRVKIGWTPREKHTYEVSAGHASTNYEDRGLIDSSSVYGEVAWQYAYSPKTRAGLAYRASRLKVERSEDQIAHQVTGRLEWQPREKIRVQLEAGAESRRTENGSKVNPVIDGRIEWQPRVGTAFYLTAYQREVASAYLAGQNYRQLGMTAGVSQRLGKRWTARLEGGRERAKYTQVSGDGADRREDRSWFVRPALEYTFTDRLRAEVFYRVSKNQSNFRNLGYDQDLAGLQLSYEF
ncbi:MAG: outer membrane beta-barrel protein [Luteolibacter sp.]